tara:strand:+ start:2534 stop:3274 length:741 start_codon:yes stop_codon:yes gene_type:complete
MTLQTEGAISLNDINIEAGNASGSTCSLNDAVIRDLIDKAAGATSSFEDFYGASSTVTFTYELIGGGGGGGYGLEDGAGTGRGVSGGASSIAATGMTTVTSAGALGGRNGFVDEAVDRDGDEERGGDASFYGAGGTGYGNGSGDNTTAGFGDAPATSYGAGGGGAGGDQGDGYDNDGNAGEGGQAATRVTGTATIDSGVTITVTIGAKGTGAIGGNYYGGDGAAGYAKITIDGTDTVFTSSGTLTV